MTQAARGARLQVIAVPVSNVGEVGDATRSLCSQKVDAIELFGNAAHAGFPSLIKVAKECRIPVFSPSPFEVVQGAILSFYPDFQEGGIQAGKMIGRVLKGESPASIPFYRVETTKLVVNAKDAADLGIKLPPDLAEAGRLGRGRGQPEAMSIDATREGGSAVLRMGGRLDRESSEQLSHTLEDLLQDGVRSLVIDLSAVTYVSSAATRVLARWQEELAVLRGDVRLTPLPSGVREMLAMAGWDSRFDAAGGPGSGPDRSPAVYVALPLRRVDQRTVSDVVRRSRGHAELSPLRPPRPTDSRSDRDRTTATGRHLPERHLRPRPGRDRPEL